jgi:hypothetical protein
VLATAVGSSDSTIAWPRTPSRASSPCAFETAARPPPAGDVDGDRHSGRSRAVRQRRQPRRADARLPRRARGGPLSVTETFVALRLDIENCGTGRAPGQRRRLRPNPTDNGSPRRQPSVPRRGPGSHHAGAQQQRVTHTRRNCGETMAGHHNGAWRTLRHLRVGCRFDDNSAFDAPAVVQVQPHRAGLAAVLKTDVGTIQS